MNFRMAKLLINDFEISNVKLTLKPRVEKMDCKVKEAFNVLETAISKNKVNCAQDNSYYYKTYSRDVQY